MSNPEFEELEQMDEVVEQAAPASVVEETETESSDAPTEGQESSSASSRLDFLKTLSVYDAMLIASALSISLAVLLMFIELTSFGGIFFQWRTSEAYVEPLAPPR